MKYTKILTFVLALFAFAGLQAQENENVKKETTVKKVTVKDANVETVIGKEVKLTKSVINVEGNSDTNQNSEEVIVKDEKKQSVELGEKKLNIENQKDLEKLKKEENKMIDGQQRGEPIEAEKEVKAKSKLTVKSKKEGGGN